MGRSANLVLAVALAALATVALAEEVPVVEIRQTELSPVEAWQADPTVVLDAEGVDLKDFLWIARPVVVFADSPRDPAFVQQMALLAARPTALAERDVAVIVDTDPAAGTTVRQKLRPLGFVLVIIGKDGRVEIRKPLPWDVEEISRTIDKMPMRQQELRDVRRGN